MATLSDLYLRSECPEIFWYVSIDLKGPVNSGIMSPFEFGSAPCAGVGIQNISLNNPIFDIRADFSDSVAGVSQVTFAIPDGDEEIKKAVFSGYWIGQTVSFYVGVEGFQKADYARAFVGVVNNLEATPYEATITVRPQQPRLSGIIRKTAYLGDGSDFEGEAGLTGSKKLLALGNNSNVSPKVLSAGNLIFQYSTGESQGASRVFDSAVEITKGPDIVFPDTVYTVAPPADGTFRDDPANSAFILGAPPNDISSITVDFEGSNDFGGYQSTTAGIILQLLTGAGYSIADIDAITYAKLQTEYPYEVGIVIEENETYEQAIRRLMSGAHGNFGIGREGLFEFWLYRTDVSSCDITIDGSDIVEGSVQRGAELPPVNQLEVNFALNNTVQSDLAQGADEDQIAFASQRYRTVFENNATIEANFGDPETVTIDTQMYGRAASSGDGLSFLNQVKGSFVGKREPYRVSVACQNFLISRGQSICFDSEIAQLNKAPFYVERVREFISENITELTLSRTIAVS